MRRIDFLIRQCRRATDNKDINALVDFEIIQYFNDAQRSIQNIIFQANGSADIFSRTKNLTLTANQTTVPLPVDIYAQNSVYDVFMLASIGGNIIQHIRRVSPKERDTIFGYVLQGKNLLLTTNLNNSATNNLAINYEAKLPIFSPILSTVRSIDTLNNTVTVGSDLLENYPEFYLEDEKFSFVDSEGVTKVNRLRLIDYTEGSTTLKFVGDLTGGSDFDGVEVGDVLCLGEDSTTHSQLMDSTETYLLAYVNRMMFGRNSDIDVNIQHGFTEQERVDLAELYADNVKDSLHPPSTDTDYLGY